MCEGARPSFFVFSSAIHLHQYSPCKLKCGNRGKDSSALQIWSQQTEEKFLETIYCSKYIHQLLAKTRSLPHHLECTFAIAKLLSCCNHSRAASTSTLGLTYDLPSLQLLRLVQVLALILPEVVVSRQQTCQDSKKSQCVHPALVHCPFGNKPSITPPAETCYSWGTGGRNTAKFLLPVSEMEEKREFFIFVRPMSSVFQRSVKLTPQRKRKIWRRKVKILGQLQGATGASVWYLGKNVN